MSDEISLPSIEAHRFKRAPIYATDEEREDARRESNRRSNEKDQRLRDGLPRQWVHCERRQATRDEQGNMVGCRVCGHRPEWMK